LAQQVAVVCVGGSDFLSKTRPTFVESFKKQRFGGSQMLIFGGVGAVNTAKTHSAIAELISVTKWQGVF
jgi:hypothetical protein